MDFQSILQFFSTISLSSTAIYTSSTIIVCAVLIIALERIFPYKPQQFFREGFFGDLFWYTLVQSYVLSILIFDVLIQWLDSSSGLGRLQIVTHWPIWVQLVFFVLVHDCYIYWFHRFQHKNKYLWRIHEAHHSVKDIDWLAGSRSHSLEILVNQTIEFAPMVLLGAPIEVIAWKGVIDATTGMFIHCNIDVRTGWLKYIINGPELHRWHHAHDKDAIDHNFSTKFAFWDYMFGTAFFPQRERKPIGYGLVRALDFPKNYFKQHLYAFRKHERAK